MAQDSDQFLDCDRCVCFGLRRAARVVTQHFDRHLRPVGLRATQFTLLVVLTRAGPMPMNRLASRLGIERTTLTRNLRPLEAKQWVRVEEDQDRRVRTVSITPAGKEVATQALGQWRKAQDTAAPLLADLQLGALLATPS
jgi:DNA-binding MarR family transcriptional regulator